MKEPNLERLLLDVQRNKWTIAGVLLSKGGWIPGYQYKIDAAFPNNTYGPDALPTVWKVSSFTDKWVHLHDYFMEADNIVGISIERLTNDETAQQGH